MRKFTLLLSTMLVAAMLIAACGAEETSTSAPATSVATMEEPTSAATSTEAAPAGTGTVSPSEGTGTPGVPVTGEENPSRLSNQLDYGVWNQDGEQIGEVDDMVLDFENSAVTYVIVGTGGFLELGEREVLVPWDSLELSTEGGDMTGGEQNAFILQTDQDTFNNAPDVDINTILPPLGQPAGDWDLEIRNYWEGGAAPVGTPSNGTPSASTSATTSTPSAGTSTTGTPSTGTTGTAVPAVTGTTLPSGTGVAAGQLQGVALATDVLGSTVTVGANGSVAVNTPSLAQGTGTPEATAMTTAMPAGTVTALPETTATGTTGTTGEGQMVTATIDDLIVDIDSGQIQYVVVNANFDNGEHLIPIPLSQFQWDDTNGAFVINVDTAMLQDAPFFLDGKYPDTTLEGWDTDYSTYWQ